ncbi:MAG TPA: hypothetical protein VGI54_00140, partial [Solirubrobacteraceae bacterium]
MDDAVAARDAFADWAHGELALPCFRYGPERSLPEVRRRAFVDLDPDTGPAPPHPTAGAACVGARRFLIAYNVWLADADVSLAREIAAAVRSPAVRALGMACGQRVQVSMNLVAPELTGLEAACTTARAEVEARGGHVCRVELVGLVPAGVLDACSPAFLAWSALSARDTLEARADGPSPGPVGGVGGAADATPGAGPGNRA